MKTLTFKQAFKYPFNRAKGMWNILWMFLPIVGWFVLGGYGIRIIREFIQGKFKELPKVEFGDDLELGFFMFLKYLPFGIAYGVLVVILQELSWAGIITQIVLGILIAPMLIINFVKKGTVKASFEFGILNTVFENFKEYVLAILKTILLGLVFLPMYIILVGIPAASFTQYIFLADFYHRYVK